MDKKLLTILVCPVTHKGLSVAKPATLKKVNAAIDEGSLKNRDGESVTDSYAEALQTDDGKLLYPVINGIPVLLEGEAVSLESL